MARMPDPLRRLERRIRRRLVLRAAGQRVVRSLPGIAQIVVAATTAYLIARFGLGHDVPVVAVTVTIIALGLARDARPRRVVETVIGINIGIIVAALIVAGIGRGIGQLALILAATLIVARAVSPSAPFAIAAAVQSMLVALLPDPETGVFARSLDGIIGGAMALAATALIPRLDVVRVRDEARALFSVLDQSLEGLVVALRHGDEPAADLALARSRRTQRLIDEWERSLESARAVADVSPWLRRHRARLRDEAQLLETADLVTRHVRALARRIDVLVRDHGERRALADVLERAAEVVRLLGRSHHEPAARYALRAVAAELAGHLAPDRIDGASVADQVVIVLLRPLAFDVLLAAGMPAEEARATLPPL